MTLAWGSTNEWVLRFYSNKGLGSLTSAITNLSSKQTKRKIVWRGQQSAHWKLTSSLQRELSESGGPVTNTILNEAENELIEASRRYPASEFKDNLSDQARLAFMQHHGRSTGLLDVTSDWQVALWFACQPTLPLGEKGRHPSG